MDLIIIVFSIFFLIKTFRRKKAPLVLRERIIKLIVKTCATDDELLQLKADRVIDRLVVIMDSPASAKQIEALREVHSYAKNYQDDRNRIKGKRKSSNVAILNAKR